MPRTPSKQNAIISAPQQTDRLSNAISLSSQHDPVRLELEDGTVFSGYGFGYRGPVAGEVVFNTGMVGYPEALTDPSYRGQILVMTYPLAGNYGVPSDKIDRYGLPQGFESGRIQAAALIVSEHSTRFSHYKSDRSLDRWLAEQQIPGVFGVDTRALTKLLRDKGSMLGRIVTDDDRIDFYDPNVTDLAAEVSVSEVTVLEPPDAGADTPTVAVVDCGCKANILRSLVKRGIQVLRLPHDHYFMNLEFDGVLLSNGPGDPQMYETTVRNVERALAIGKPILGICLGNQILARAIGCETYKLKFGHRSHNQPCIEHRVEGGVSVPSQRCYITSQNHGYAVREQGLPRDWRVWFSNANDGTVEGIRHISKPFMSVQFHPEATPGPVDTDWIFDEFASYLTK